MKEVLKRIGSVLVDILIVIVFIVSTIVVIASITANRTGGQPSVMGYVFSSVQTNSMQGTIDKGDFVVGKLIDDNTKIKEGDIISYYDYIGGKQVVVTHRVIEIIDPDTVPGYVTQGDNEKYPDDIVKTRDTLHSVYKFRIPFLGKFIDFLKTPFGFIITLVIPLLSFIAWQAYKLILLFFKSKQAELEEQAEQLKNTQNAKSELSEEEKNAIIAEYLAKQKAQEKENDDAKNKNNKN
jgi:signal peptidase